MKTETENKQTLKNLSECMRLSELANTIDFGFVSYWYRCVFV